MISFSPESAGHAAHAAHAAQASRRPPPQGAIGLASFNPAMHRHAAERDAIDVLMSGQLAARELISRYARLRHSPGFGPTARRALAEQLCVELALHLHLEGELFFPALLATVDEADALDTACVEHDCLRDLLHRVLTMPADAPRFDAHVGVLGEMFDMHLSRALAELYPLARQTTLDLRWLGEAMEERREQLLEQVAQGHSIDLDEDAPPSDGDAPVAGGRAGPGRA